MDTNQHLLKKRFFYCLLPVVATACNLFAYEVSVGEATVWPGISVQVPVLLDDATDVSTIQFQINYDPQLLALVSITNALGTLGSAFTLDYENDDGMLVVLLYREESLMSGSGQLVSLEFAVHSGAEVEMESALILADVGLGDQNGKDLLWGAPLAVVHGALRVLPSENADSDGDGLPDRWEYIYSGGITNLLASSNDDGDMLNNLEEYIAGLNPTTFDEFIVSIQEDSPIPEIYWNSVSGRIYNVYWTSNLLDEFTLIQSNIHWSAGSFTDEIHTDEVQGFYIIDVSLEP